MVDDRSEFPIIINRDAGALHTKGIKDPGGCRAWVDEHRHSSNLEYLRARDVEEALRSAVREGHRRIAVGGGDGTVNTAAALCVAANVELVVLPLGTLNHFAKDIGVPLEAEHWQSLICSPRTQQVDVGYLGERLFLNNFSVGFYPKLAKVRSEIEHERLLGSKKLATAWSLLKVSWQRHRALHIEIDVPNTEFPKHRECAAIVVANNAYDLHIDNLAGRSTLDSGELATYVVWDSLKISHLLKVLMAEDSDASDGIERVTSSEIILEPKRRRVRVAIDGELMKLETPLIARSKSAAFSVVVPP